MCALHDCGHPSFPCRVLRTDEAVFTRSVVHSLQNLHIWTAEKLFVTLHSSTDFVSTFGSEVYVDDYVIGAYVIQHRLSGAQYADFLEETLQSL
jgi:hypothetical protein